jgi:bis(5'-adenosyl)-triphosphatase
MNHSIPCPFCDPAVQAATFAETERFRAIYNIAPILPGHSLVLPKAHVEGFMDLNDEDAAGMMVFARQVARLLGTAFQASAFDWTIQDGLPAGQTVPHLHLHLIPRKTDDLPSPGDWYPRLEESEKGLAGVIDSAARSRLKAHEMKTIVEYLRNIRGQA